MKLTKPSKKQLALVGAAGLGLGYIYIYINTIMPDEFKLYLKSKLGLLGDDYYNGTTTPVSTDDFVEVPA